MKLTAKQRIFAETYALTNNGTESAISAGYSEHTATAIAAENLRKPHVAQAIEEFRRPLRDTRIRGYQDVMDGLWATVDDPDTKPAVRVQALAQIGKFLGMGADSNKARSSAVDKAIGLLTDEELDTVLARDSSPTTLIEPPTVLTEPNDAM